MLPVVFRVQNHSILEFTILTIYLVQLHGDGIRMTRSHCAACVVLPYLFHRYAEDTGIGNGQNAILFGVGNIVIRNIYFLNRVLVLFASGIKLRKVLPGVVPDAILIHELRCQSLGINLLTIAHQLEGDALGADQALVIHPHLLDGNLGLGYVDKIHRRDGRVTIQRVALQLCGKIVIA